MLAGALPIAARCWWWTTAPTDGTADLLAARHDIQLVRHPANQGYGAALRSAFDFAVDRGYDVLVTIDCDGQHQPQLIPKFVEHCRAARRHRLRQPLPAALSGRQPAAARPPPHQRADHRGGQPPPGPGSDRRLLRLQGVPCDGPGEDRTDRDRLRHAVGIVGPGRGLRLRIVELPVPCIYLDEKRSFGGALDNAEKRLAVYREVLDKAERGLARAS